MNQPITDENIVIDDNSPNWTCIYCGRQWPPTEPVKVLQDHVLECELHPAAIWRNWYQNLLADHDGHSLTILGTFEDNPELLCESCSDDQDRPLAIRPPGE